jgi:hypothetical protein
MKKQEMIFKIRILNRLWKIFPQVMKRVMKIGIVKQGQLATFQSMILIKLTLNIIKTENDKSKNYPKLSQKKLLQKLTKKHYF